MPTLFLPAQLGSPCADESGRHTDDDEYGGLKESGAMRTTKGNKSNGLKERLYKHINYSKTNEVYAPLSGGLALDRRVQDHDDEIDTGSNPIDANGDVQACITGSTRGTFDQTVCGECGQALRSSDIKQHQAQDCSERLVLCKQPGCNTYIRACDREWHEESDCSFVRKRKRLLANAARANKGQGVLCNLCQLPCGKTATERKQHAEFCLARLVDCPNAHAGCRAQIEARDIEAHLETCKILQVRETLSDKYWASYDFAECKQCSQEIEIRFMISHLAEDCKARLVECPQIGCTHKLPFREIEFHTSESGNCSVAAAHRALLERGRTRQVVCSPCVFGCGEDFPESLMSHHCKNECPYRFVTCTCGAVVRSKDREAHSRGNLYYTLHMIPQCIFAVKRDGLAELADARGRKPATCPCPLGCGEQIVKLLRKQHMAEECPYRMVSCEFAGIGCNLGPGAKLQFNELADHHETECPGAMQRELQIKKGIRMQTALYDCRNGCGQRLRRGEMANHEKLTCERRLVQCYLNCGQFVPLEDMHMHQNEECRFGIERNYLARRSAARKNGEASPRREGEESAEGEEEEEEEWEYT